MNNFSLSIIICSYNPKKEYLNRALLALAHQTLNKNQWELLLIDNNSDEALSETYDLSWHPNSKHVIEKKQGLIAARLKGIRESKGKLLIFVDDDNILSKNYLELTFSLGDKHPDIGCFGGSIKPEYEVEPDSKLQKYTGKLAIRTIWEDKISNSYSDSQPWGAGLVIRKKIAVRYAKCVKGNARESLGRIGSNLSSAEDIDMTYTSIDMGYNNGLFKTLELIHIIPKERLTFEYMSKINLGISYSCMLLRYYRFNKKPSQHNPLVIQRIKHVYKKITMHKIDYIMYRSSEKAKIKFFDTINN
jgi:glycosyltransferase involved in cell wall biosynthesis